MVLLGIGDFLAGLGGRRLAVEGSTATMAWVASVVGTVVAGVYLLVVPPEAFGGADLAWALVAGVLVSFARPLLYLGMAKGPIVVFAPVFALFSVAVPVLVGPFVGESLAGLEIVGIVLALPAVVMVSSEDRVPRPREAVRSPAFALAVLVGTILGLIALTFSAIDQSAGAGPAFVSQAVGIVGVPLAARTFGRVARLGRGMVSWGAGVGAIEIVAVIANVAAFQRGSAAVVAAVLGLTPVVSIVLAWRVLAEPIHRVQVVGSAFGVASILLFSLAS